MNITVNEYVTDHFKFSECVCNCCNRLMITPLFYFHMEKLEALRQICDFPIMINSGYRCPSHNVAIGGAEKSWHMKFATDIRPAWVSGKDENEYLKRLKKIHKTALKLDFGGVGIYSTFVHCDLRPVKTRWKG